MPLLRNKARKGPARGQGWGALSGHDWRRRTLPRGALAFQAARGPGLALEDAFSVPKKDAPIPPNHR